MRVLKLRNEALALALGRSKSKSSFLHVSLALTLMKSIEKEWPTSLSSETLAATGSCADDGLKHRGGHQYGTGRLLFCCRLKKTTHRESDISPNEELASSSRTTSVVASIQSHTLKSSTPRST